MSLSTRLKVAVLLGAGALLPLVPVAVGAPEATALATEGGAFNPVAPERVLDTREYLGPIPGGGSFSFDLRPASHYGAAAVALNVTATQARAPGHLTVQPTGWLGPDVSSLNFVPGQTVANSVTTLLGNHGRITLRNGSPEPVHVIVDLTGWYAAGLVEEAGVFGIAGP